MRISNLKSVATQSVIVALASVITAFAINAGFSPVLTLLFCGLSGVMEFSRLTPGAASVLKSGQEASYITGGREWHGFCFYDGRKGGKMKKQTFIILCLAFCVSFGFSSPQGEEYYSYSFARLNYVKGDVFIQRTEDMGYEEGTVNLPIVEGDKLGTQDGRAEIHFGRKNFLRIDKYTQIDFVKLPQRGDDFVSLHLVSGNIYLRVNSLNTEKEFELHSPDGSFYILEEGLYRFEVRDNQETALFVVEGSIEAAGEGGSEIVRVGERMVAANGFFNGGPEYIYAGNEDTFTEWNRGRDIFHNRYVRTRYLPVDMYEYEAELDYYGRWVYERPHGYVWIPDVYQYSWRPYYHGRWIWYPVCGWTWCSYEPWGWCVSHYGRWHWRGGLGWYWIPTRSWGPAWVHWYHGIDYIGWSPLSYYNRPVVIVNNRFYGRHYDRYYPAHSRAFTVIRKDQLSARHVSKVALSQSGMSRLGKVSLSSKQPMGRPASSRINIKSSAASKALSRSNIRSVTKGYSSGRSIRSSVGKSLAQPAGTSRINNRSGTVSRSGVSSIKTYPSKNNSSLKTSRTYASSTKRSLSGNNAQMSRSPSRSSSSRTGIKAYPSQRISVRKSRTSSTSKARSYSPSSSRSSSSSAIKRYSSQSRSSISSALSRKSIPTRSTYRSSPSRSISSRSSYSTPSRSTTRIKSSSSSTRSYSPSRVSSSRSSSISRSFQSTSRTRVSRSTPSRSSASRSISRSSSAKRVKKK